MAEKKLPKNTTIKKWKESFSWLRITETKKLVCVICSSQEEKIKLMPRVNLTFVTGGTNYKLSALQDHHLSEGHKRAVKEEEAEKAKAAGLSIPPVRIVQNVLENSAISKGFKQMGETERAAISKLHDIAYYIALKGRAFTDFVDLIELEKLHEVNFQAGAYENESACRDFVNNIADYFFQKDLYEKLVRVNFIAILCDGSTDRSVTEQEVVYVMFTDPDTFKPTLSFFEVLGLDSSQDATGICDAIKAAFKKRNLESALDKLVFFSSDGASVNSGKKSGLIALFREEYEWVSFIWCFSHRLELALKDALQEFIDPVEETLRHLYYLYEKSSKKHRELKNLFKLLKNQYEFYGAGVKPIKATGTRWIDHKLRAMERVVDKYGLYCQHLQHLIPETKNSKDRATLQGKFNKMIEAKVPLRCAFFVDILSSAKVFSLTTQKLDINIIEIVDSVETTKRSYEKLFKKT